MKRINELGEFGQTETINPSENLSSHYARWKFSEPLGAVWNSFDGARKLPFTAAENKRRGVFSYAARVITISAAIKFALTGTINIPRDDSFTLLLGQIAKRKRKYDALNKAMVNSSQSSSFFVHPVVRGTKEENFLSARRRK